LTEIHTLFDELMIEARAGDTSRLTQVAESAVALLATECARRGMAYEALTLRSAVRAVETAGQQLAPGQARALGREGGCVIPLRRGQHG
jgi:hypothetical protein